MRQTGTCSKTDTFHKFITYEQHVLTSSDEIISSSRHEFGRVDVFRRRRIKKREELKKSGEGRKE